MTIISSNSLNKALLVFARHLVDEMRYINYPKEWSQAPLKELLPTFFEVLNYHPERLGSVVGVAYEHAFPEFQNGNLNQLGNTMTEPTRDYEIFGKTREYYLDEYEVMQSQGESERVKNDDLADKIRILFEAIINTFAALTPQQENEHRTLEHVCFALAPVYARVQGVEDMGWGLAEYADNWRNLSADERVNLKKELLSLY